MVSFEYRLYSHFQGFHAWVIVWRRQWVASAAPVQKDQLSISCNAVRSCINENPNLEHITKIENSFSRNIAHTTLYELNRRFVLECIFYFPSRKIGFIFCTPFIKFSLHGFWDFRTTQKRGQKGNLIVNM